NLQTIRIVSSSTPKLKTSLRHVDIHQSWLRQEVLEGRIDAEWVPSMGQLADGLTKILPIQRHEQWLHSLQLSGLKTHRAVKRKRSQSAEDHGDALNRKSHEPPSQVLK